MTGIIVTGHGRFASGLQSSIELIVGKQEQAVFVDFLAEETAEDLEKNIREAAATLDGNGGIIFLTDLVGGSPFKISAVVSKDFKVSGVVAGTNLPMLLDLLFVRSSQNAIELMKKSVKSGAEGIKTFKANGEIHCKK